MAVAQSYRKLSERYKSMFSRINELRTIYTTQDMADVETMEPLN